MKVNTLPLQRVARHIAASPDTITVGPRLDASCAKQFARTISRMADRRAPFVIIDMAKTEAVDSSGFGSLISGLRKLAEAGAGAVIVCSNASVRRLMDFAGVTRMIAVVDSTKEARSLQIAHQPGALAS